MVNKTFRTSQSGYSLIEVMTGVAIFGILSLLSINLFLSTTVGATKNNTSRTVKQTGDHILLLMENSLRGARHLTANSDSPSVVCDDDMQSIAYVDLETGAVERWAVSQGKIQLNDVDVTSGDLSIKNNRLYIRCLEQESSGVIFISVNFTLTKGSASSDREEEYISHDFATSVTLRNR